MLQTPVATALLGLTRNIMVDQDDKIVGYLSFVTAAAGEAGLSGLQLTTAAEYLLVYAIAHYAEEPLSSAAVVSDNLIGRVREMMAEKASVDRTLEQVYKIIDEAGQ